MLSDRDIRRAMARGEIYIDGRRRGSIQPASVDLFLGPDIVLPNHGNQRQPLWDGVVLHPGDFALGSTTEYITLGREHAARFEGRSSLGRVGLLTHVSAGFIDPGFSGQITVEIVNLSGRDIVLKEGMPIGQICFERLDSPAKRAYGDPGAGSHYQGQSGPTISAREDELHRRGPDSPARW